MAYPSVAGTAGAAKSNTGAGPATAARAASSAWLMASEVQVVDGGQHVTDGPSKAVCDDGDGCKKGDG